LEVDKIDEEKRTLIKRIISMAVNEDKGTSKNSGFYIN